jgi:hypothetical protein
MIKLSLGIARGRSCASILIVSRRKMSLVDAFHDWCPWPSLSSRVGDGEHAQTEKVGGRRRGHRLDVGAWRGCNREGHWCWLYLGAACCCLCVVCCAWLLYQEEGNRAETRKRREKGKKEKKSWVNFQT